MEMKMMTVMVLRMMRTPMMMEMAFWMKMTNCKLEVLSLYRYCHLSLSSVDYLVCLYIVYFHD